MLVSDVMTTNVVSIPSGTNLAEANHIMEAHHFRRIPVIDRGKLVGIVSKDELDKSGPSKLTSFSIHEITYMLYKRKAHGHSQKGSNLLECPYKERDKMTELLISELVVARLPHYLRTLQFIEKEGKQFISSKELAGRLGCSSALIRKDFSYFGGFGKQGTGYDVIFLQKQLRRILNIDQILDVALIGVGDLGRALADYRGFLEHGFRLVALFDNAPQKIGTTVGGLTVQGMTELASVVSEKKLKIIILAVPPQVVQALANILVGLGVRAILNYASVKLNTPSDVRVHHIDPAFE